MTHPIRNFWMLVGLIGGPLLFVITTAQHYNLLFNSKTEYVEIVDKTYVKKTFCNRSGLCDEKFVPEYKIHPLLITNFSEKVHGAHSIGDKVAIVREQGNRRNIHVGSLASIYFSYAGMSIFSILIFLGGVIWLKTNPHDD